jgi:hypothetical protein
MSDFKFNCPHCQQSLEAPEDLLGQTIECPQCKGSIQLPAPQPRLQPAKKKVALRSQSAMAAPRPIPQPPSQPAASHAGQTVGGIATLIAVIAGAWWYFGGGLEQQAAHDMGQIEQQVAADAVKQYEIAKRSGSAMDAYVHAGLVCAAYLQAKDEANYQKWKAIERQEGIRAGMDPSMLQ